MKDWSLLYLISEWSIRLVMFIYVPQRRSTAAFANSARLEAANWNRRPLGARVAQNTARLMDSFL